MAKRRRYEKKDKLSKIEQRLLELEEARKKKNKILAAVVVVVIVIIVAYTLIKPSGELNPEATQIESNANKILVSMSDIDDGQIHYYKASGIETEFYVHKNPQGRIKTRISVCEPCAGTRFTLLDGGNILDCNVCHTRWDSETYAGIYPQPGENRVGGCEDYPPPYLPHRIEGNYVVILKSDLEGEL